ncbi:hypothetical protein GJU40_05365 [Bacillus lacus]|uniref:YqcI/YcgG family protein n=1 Tax=Metabacillus lacus TaxID=1983721 RepID=A0A7X2IXS1_9BACI|nr:YqcI/YcgG family protein [Metabacillus lacus]MRX71605.1 hypothetical protein [Metabacillus lacus]
MQLYNKEELEHYSAALEEWKLDAYYAFCEKMENKSSKFPCIPAQLGYAKDHFRYAFIGNPAEEGASRELGMVMEAFAELDRTGQYSSLVIFFDSSSLHDASILDYERLFWRLLSDACSHDKKEWPLHLSDNPEDNSWEFAFHGEPYFVYCGTPAHENRLSRKGKYLTLALTPRWVLQEFQSSGDKSEKIKMAIRERLQKYDEVLPHPELKWYGQEDNFEWKQYFLRDDATSPSKCPFLRALNKDENSRKH